MMRLLTLTATKKPPVNSIIKLVLKANRQDSGSPTGSPVEILAVSGPPALPTYTFLPSPTLPRGR